jgi:hypothetical protein
MKYQLRTPDMHSMDDEDFDEVEAESAERAIKKHLYKNEFAPEYDSRITVQYEAREASAGEPWKPFEAELYQPAMETRISPK